MNPNVDQAIPKSVVTSECIVCGTAGTALHQDLEDRLFGVGGRWDLDQCGDPRCRLIWLHGRPADADLGRLYTTYYTHDGDPAGAVPGSYRSGGWRKRLKRMMARLRPGKAARYRTDLLHLEGMAPGDALEVGCGSGDFLRALGQEGWRTTGIDFDERAVNAARRLGIDARLGSLDDQSFENASFDAIVLNNVIEHVPDPAATIAACHRMLRPGGRLVMITPNADALGRRLYGPDWRGLEVPRHLFIFTVDTLHALSRRAGFRTADTFTSTGGGAVHGILSASADIAARSGRPRRDARHRGVIRREKLMILAGRPVGEWVVQVAHRDR